MPVAVSVVSRFQVSYARAVTGSLPQIDRRVTRKRPTAIPPVNTMPCFGLETAPLASLRKQAEGEVFDELDRKGNGGFEGAGVDEGARRRGADRDRRRCGGDRGRLPHAQDTAPQNRDDNASAPIEEVTVSARRRNEAAQDVPIPVSVVSGQLISDVGAFNVNRIKELVPTVQLYSSNPRNTALNIRGLGTTFGLTNDGIEGGVGYYVDGVYFARPAAQALDFIDVDRVEVLRGPQGTLFGKNTTAGAIVVTTRKPSFTPEATFELGYGNEDFVQAKGSFSGPLGEKFAGRISFSSTQRDGNVYNVRTNEWINNARQPRCSRAAAVHPVRQDQRHCLDRLHEARAERLRAGARGCRADAACRLPAIQCDRGRPRLHAGKPQSVRSNHRYRHAVAIEERPWRRLGQRRHRPRQG